MGNETATECPLPPVRRVVTGHNDDATAVVKSDGPVKGIPTGHGPSLVPLWATMELPPDVSSPEEKGLVNPPNISTEGAVLRVLDLPPQSKGALHRTVTLDYLYVIQGHAVLTLDDGSRTPVKANDVVIQQATMHGWDNETDQWTRILVIMMRSQAPVAGGKRLEEMVPFSI